MKTFNLSLVMGLVPLLVMASGCATNKIHTSERVRDVSILVPSSSTGVRAPASAADSAQDRVWIESVLGSYSGFEGTVESFPGPQYYASDYRNIDYADLMQGICSGFVIKKVEDVKETDVYQICSQGKADGRPEYCLPVVISAGAAKKLNSSTRIEESKSYTRDMFGLVNGGSTSSVTLSKDGAGALVSFSVHDRDWDQVLVTRPARGELKVNCKKK